MVLGRKLYGRLNGIIMTVSWNYHDSQRVSGGISLLQYPLIDLAERICGGQYFYVDLVIFAICGVGLFILLVPLNKYVDRKENS